MIQTILNLVQPLAVLVFITAGILSLIVKQYHQAAVNLCIALANFMIFYGERFFK